MKTMKNYNCSFYCYTKAIETDPSFAPGYFRSKIQVLTEKPENGHDDFKKALEPGQNKALEYVAKYCK